MKLTINYITRASKVLNLNVEEIEEYAKRVKGHLNKCLLNNECITTNMIIQSVFIIQDIQNKKLEKQAKELQVKNPVLRKYQKDIKDLSALGMGSTRISKELKTKFKVNLSSSSIYRFLKMEIVNE